MRVTIVGAGVAGLTCGVTLARAGHDVTVVARDVSPATTSDVAAAVWYPLRGERDPRCDRWLPYSFERFCELAGDASSGVMLRGGLELFREQQDDTWWRDLLPGFRHARADELPPGYADGFIADGVPVIEMPVYMGWLAAAFRDAGGSVERRAVSSVEEVPGDVVVNCAGLGARELVPDPAMRAVRGQVVRVEQFGLERYILDEGNPLGVLYVYPRSRDVVCGGTREEGDESLDVRPDLEQAILSRCAVLEPRVLQARVVSRGVGLRPSRSGGVRLEAEERGGRLVVHNYGHGGNGVTLSWGCAREAAESLDRARR